MLIEQKAQGPRKLTLVMFGCCEHVERNVKILGVGVGITELSHSNPLCIIEPLKWNSTRTKNTLLYENQVKHWCNAHKSVREKQTQNAKFFMAMQFFFIFFYFLAKVNKRGLNPRIDTTKSTNTTRLSLKQHKIIYYIIK